MSREMSLGVRWLIRLRWLLLLAQSLAAAVSVWMGRPSLGIALGVLLVVALSNAGLWWLARRSTATWWVGPVLLADTALLSLLLHATGGPMNPFSVLYLVHITLAAMLLEAGWVWAVVAAAFAGFAVLFVGSAAPRHMHDMSTHLRGMWLAFAVASALVAFFVTRLSRELKQRDRELLAAREQTARSERLAALTSLAASAAHEIGTPIGTIAIAAGELERTLELEKAPAEALHDVRLIREEIRRCRRVLDDLARRAGELPGEALASARLDDLVAEVRARLPGAIAQALVVDVDDARASLPRTAVVLACTSLVRNAFDASGPGGTVDLRAHATAHEVVFEVEDAGRGMAPEVRARATEPFFTTRASEGGLGLGLFLTQALADRLGGRLELESALERGTRARLVLPRIEASA